MPHLLAFCLTWIFFFYINFSGASFKKIKEDLLKKNFFFYKITSYTALRFGIFIQLFLIVLLFIKKPTNNAFFFSHLIDTEFANKYNIIFLIIMTISLMLTNTYTIHKLEISADYFFSIINLNILAPLIFMSNTLFSFLFIIELLSSIFFFLFIYNSKKSESKKESITIVLFFQYWASFFSTLIFVFVLLNLTKIFGSTEWTFLNFISKSNICFSFLGVNINWNNIFIFCLFFAIIVKIGLAPIHIYKLELYKNLPLLTIFFYTLIFVQIYLIFFVIFLIKYINILFLPIFFIFVLLIIFCIVFLILYIYNYNLLNYFLFFSTLILVINIFILILGFFI